MQIAFIWAVTTLDIGFALIFRRTFKVWELNPVACYLGIYPAIAFRVASVLLFHYSIRKSPSKIALAFVSMVHLCLLEWYIMNFLEWFGLVIMILALLITIGILLYDLFALKMQGKETISGHQWDKLRAWYYDDGPFPWLVLILPLGVSIQAIGLLIHFLGGL